MSIIKNYFKQNKVTHTFSSCQWPIGDPQEKDFQFCDAGTAVGKPYCQQHCDVAYIDEKELKKEKIFVLLIKTYRNKQVPIRKKLLMNKF